LLFIYNRFGNFLRNEYINIFDNYMIKRGFLLMPTYEYKCRKCKRIYEVFQSMLEKPLETCDICGGKVKRLIGTGAGIIFKGTGFYCTDYKKPTGEWSWY